MNRWFRQHSGLICLCIDRVYGGDPLLNIKGPLERFKAIRSEELFVAIRDDVANTVYD